MTKKRTGRFEDHPQVIGTCPRPVGERARMTPAAFAERYYPLYPLIAPQRATLLVTLVDGVMRYEVEVPPLLINYGVRSGR